jgi:two-component system sensor histidine kinase/response regulator
MRPAGNERSPVRGRPGPRPRVTPASEQWFGPVFAAARDGMVLIDDARRAVAANRAAGESLGLAPELIVGRRIDDVAPVALREALAQRWEAFLRDGHDQAEYEIRESDDAAPLVLEVIATARIAAGRHLLTLRDVTERALERRLLERQREQLVSAQAIGGFGTWDWDLASGVLEVSGELTRLGGFPPGGRLAAETIEASVHPDDRERRRAFLATARVSGEPFVHEFRIVTPDGTVRLLESRGETIAAADGTPLRMLGTAQDITDRRQAEIERTNLSTMLDASDDAITACSRDIVFVSWNRGAERIYGYSAEEAIGQPLELIMSPQEREIGYEVSRRVLAGERIEAFESMPRTKDGRRVVISLTLSPVFDATGTVTAVAAIGRDITAHKEDQEALGEAHARVVRALRLKSEFMANMNHELRTPLNGVLGAANLLVDTVLSEEQREYVAALRVSGDALMAVIEDILDFSKIEAGKLELEDEPFELRGVVEDVSSIVALSTLRHGVELLASLASELPERVWGDETRVRQVLTNLLSNAAKFTLEGEVLVRVIADAPGWLRVEVADSGIGIDPGAHESIFESFAQADGSTTRRFGGTGLGLAIAKQLVTLMGGRIGVESTPDVGSTFWFALPLRAAPPDAARVALARLDGLRVLVCDDNEAGRAILRRELEQHGAEVSSAGDAGAALEELRAGVRRGGPHHVALVDLEMPGAGGDELARMVRGEASLDACRIVLMATADCDPDVKAQAPTDAFVVKPVRAERLHNEIIRTVRSAAAGPAPAAADDRAGAATEPRSARRVLLAEDNEINQLVASRLLKRSGFAVDIAANGREAVELHGERVYDAIFMDCQMPELDGYEATREIRRREGSRCHTPIIAMTASTLPGDNERCIAAGMDYFTGKPIRPDELRAVIAQALRLAAGGAA